MKCKNVCELDPHSLAMRMLEDGALSAYKNPHQIVDGFAPGHRRRTEAELDQMKDL